MGSPAREADLMTRRGGVDESRCLLVLLPPETKMQIISHLSTQNSLSRLGQSCRAWHEVANEELYKRDSRENNSFAIKWMAFHAVDEQTTDSAIRTLEISRRWGGQIDAVQPHLLQSHRALSKRDPIMYETSTALHFAVLLGNMRLTKTILDMKASLTIQCSPVLWRSMGSKELSRKVEYFRRVLNGLFNPSGPVFPLFLAFLQGDTGMCELLVEHGAGREAIIVDSDTDPKAMSILHFAAADPTTDYRQWRCLFDRFREHIDEPSPQLARYTPLHIALKTGCTQGMQIAVESGADKESRSDVLHTPLSLGIQELKFQWNMDSRTFEEHMRCLRKFVDLGASVNPEGDSPLGIAMRPYMLDPVNYPLMRHVIYFLLEHHVDINRPLLLPYESVVFGIIRGIILNDKNRRSLKLLKQLLTDLIDRGLNITAVPGQTSPLYRVLINRKAEPKWLFDLLCEKGATIHAYEVDGAFLRWCDISRFWRKNKYNAWWQHQGQEDEIFQKWCEHPYNAWWWQHVKKIPPYVVSLAYEKAPNKKGQLYDILTHLPLSKLGL
ncbi:uncharacterized protein CPUR_05653 [Claviceps purpurea 20.1]|uniref:F-box domain-containing protein n=1 Tax=Claviceps purpurea (strain 20.1) TaxID=1111077 RepID=M1WCS6_CLAP2|nr:uncharacterized protein CPUR_05653 [Claviceps purpurea 20.1]